MCEEIELEKVDVILNAAKPVSHHDVATDGDVCAIAASVDEPRNSDSEVPLKKRKTRRGKSKRHRNAHPYSRSDGALTTKMVKAEAPYNSNRFLIEDHGDIEYIDKELNKADQASTSTITRTRDSSFSMDSECEFYSTPNDEEVFLIKDFDDQYESVQAERLQLMSKDELIKEYLLLEGKVELLTKRLQGSETHSKYELEIEIQRLRMENDAFRRENDRLLASIRSSSDSADSETDSSDTCSSSSSAQSHSESPLHLNNAKTSEETNGFSSLCDHSEQGQTL